MGYRKVLVTALLLISLLLTGCNGARETDEVAYVIGIGFDKHKDEMIKVTYQIAIARALGGEGSASSKESTVLLSVIAPSHAEARTLLKTTLGRTPNLSHNKVFFIGEELAKGGIGYVTAPLIRHRDFRGSMYLVTIQNGTAEDFIKKMQPKLEILPSKYVETMMLTSNEAGYYPQSFLHDFYSRLKGKSAAPYTALAALNSPSGRNAPEGVRSKGDKAFEYTAGNIPMTNHEATINFAGIALYKDDKMVGTLTTEETRMVQILSNKFPRGFLVISDPQSPKKLLHLNMRLGEAPKIKASVADKKYFFDVSVLLEGEITAIASATNYERPDLRQVLEEHISETIRHDIMKMLVKTQRLKADVVGFGYHARTLYATFPEWRSIGEDWNDHYSEAEIRVTVSTKIRRSGLMWQTTPIKKED